MDKRQEKAKELYRNKKKRIYLFAKLQTDKSALYTLHPAMSC